MTVVEHARDTTHPVPRPAYAQPQLIAFVFLGGALGASARLGLTAIVLGESWSEIANGLANYSGVLTAIALAVTFLKSSTASWIYALPWIVITAVVTLGMHRAGWETYTWPYILTTWVALVVAYYVRGLRRA